MFLIILIKSLIIGGLVGVGGRRSGHACLHAPTTSGWGAFPYSGRAEFLRRRSGFPLSFGLGFFFNARASSVAAGSFHRDVDHRIIPELGAAALM